MKPTKHQTALILITLALLALLAATAPAQMLTLESPSPVLFGAFGNRLSGIPDVDGDGLGDVAVSESGANRVHVFSGATGSLLRTLVFGGWCSGSGVDDLDGDGRGDIIVGGLHENGGAVDSGRVHIVSGATGATLRTLVSPNPEDGGGFGGRVAGIPDVDGDGRGDVLVGAWGESPGSSPEEAGRAHIFSGATGTLLHTLVSPNEEVWSVFGWAVSGVPDVDGDGRGDVVIGTENESRVHIFSGATGALLHTLVSPTEPTAGTFGQSVSGIDDVDGDGWGDVIVGSRMEGVGGRAHLFSGATGGLIRTLQSPNEEPGGEFGGRYGRGVAGIPDINGDGRGDVAVGARYEISPRVYVFSGATGALLNTLEGQSGNPGGFGGAVAGCPDTTGDGLGQVLVGATGEDVNGIYQAGRAYLFRGLTTAVEDWDLWR